MRPEGNSFVSAALACGSSTEKMPRSMTDAFCVPIAPAMLSSPHECRNDSSQAGSNRDTNASPLRKSDNGPLSRRPPSGSWSYRMRASFPQCQKGSQQISRDSDLQHVEELRQLMSEFKKHFTTVHTEWTYVDWVCICVTCLSAIETLAKIREAIIKNLNVRDLVLRDEEFMKLLVKLLMLDSPGLPRICSVNCSRTRSFYESGEYRGLKASVNVDEDDAGEKLWEGILGKAAEAIRLPTYTINVHASSLPGLRRFTWPRTDAREALGDVPRSNTPKTTKPKVDLFPESDLRAWRVVRCLDARHLFVCRGASGREGVNSLNNVLAEWHRDSRPIKDRPEVGEILGLLTSSECMLRVLVVDLVSDTAVVWSVDQGNFIKVPWHYLVDLLPSFKCLPPAIGLGVIQDVNAVPFLSLLRECIRTFQALTGCHLHGSEGTAWCRGISIRSLTSLGVVEVLSNLLECSDHVTREASAACLIQLCKLQDGSQAVFETGCVHKVRERLRQLAEQPQHDPETFESEGKILVNFLDAVFFHNEELRRQYANMDDVALIIKIQECPLSYNFSPAVQSCLETLVGLSHGSRCPVSPKQVALRPEPLKDWNSVHTPCKEMQHCYGLGAGPSHAGPQSAGSKCASNAPPPEGSLQVPSGRCYLLNTIVPFKSDDTHELQPSSDLRKVSVPTLAKIICSLLNTWQLCTIFYGITSDGLVRGVKLSYKGRDIVRLKIDRAVRLLQPCLIPQSLAVKFVPVLRTEQDVYEEASFFIVEVSVLGVPRTLYTVKDICYFRECGQSYEATGGNVSHWIALLEEVYCLQAQEPLPIETSQLP